MKKQRLTEKTVKVLGINSSLRRGGNTQILLDKALEASLPRQK